MSRNTAAISIALDQPRFNWMVCPADPRWLTAVRRFSSELTPIGCLMPVIAAEPDVIMDLLSIQRAGIVLWTVTNNNLGDCCDKIAEIAMTVPSVLQLAAASELSVVERAALGELGVSLTIRHPEEVPKLAHLIDVYFARLA